MRELVLALVAACAFTGVGAAEPEFEQLPITGMYKVTEADGTVRYLSSNRRFVFVGKMYDLWQGDTMEAGVAVSQKFDWNRNGVSIEKISFPLGDGTGTKTIFIAPECDDCKELLRYAYAMGETDLNVVLLASSEAGQKTNSAIWCAKDRAKLLRSVYLDGKTPKPSDISSACDRFGLMLAEQAALLFGVGQLPLFVDENGNGHAGEAAIYAMNRK